MHYFYNRKIRFLLTVLLVIGVLSFIGWLVCFIMGLCDWKLGVIIIIPTVLILLILFLLYSFTPKCCARVPNDNSCWSGDCEKGYGMSEKKWRNRIDHEEVMPKGKTYLPKKPRQNKKNAGYTYSSVFAPAEVRRKTNMLVQVYIHLLEETEKVKALAKESQRNAKRRDYIPLQCKLKKGDKVNVLFNIYGETILMSDKKSVIWQGSFTNCSFNYFVPKDINVEELSCMALLSVNDIPVGEMRFITKIVDTPREINPEIIAHKYHKVFVSYSHLDEPKVKFLHEGLEIAEVPHFFDRKYLKAGDMFPKIIQDYINSADLFILCWSDNASKSEYVNKERLQALSLAFPQVQPEREAKLRIYPMSIEPRAELPNDMRHNYHFEVI